jgi:RNA polymerase sigma-70 factor (ECF subfamily)
MMSAMKSRMQSEWDGDGSAEPHRWARETAREPGVPAPRRVMPSTSRQPVDLAAEVALARTGDEDAFRTIFRAVQPGLLRFVRGMVGNDAEDVTSEAWAQIARDIRSFHGDSDGFRAWAATIARHRALDHLRRQQRRPQPSMTSVEDLGDLVGGDDTAAAALEILSTDAAVALINALPRDQAEAIMLRVVLGLDAQSAGRVLGKRAGAVRAAAHRGLRRLFDQLNRAAEG